MTWMDNFTQAIVIMCLGMGLVFLFVGSLVVLIQVSARVLSTYIKAETLAPPAPTAGSPNVTPDANQGAIVAAIAMAMKQHSSSRPQA